MKDIFKIVKITAIGLTIAILIYPFTHELGHAITSLLVGADVSGFEILPIPYVECNIGNLSKYEIIAIGFGGNTLPLIIIVIIDIFSSINKNKYHFELYYAKVYFYFCCLLSFIISSVSNALNIKTDDIYQLIEMYPLDKNKITFTCIVITILIIVRMIKIDIITRFMDYVDN